MEKLRYIAIAALTIVAVFVVTSLPQIGTVPIAQAATTTMTLTSAGASYWVAPQGVTSITVTLRGGGGGGGGCALDTNDAAGAGAGSQYVSSSTFAVIPGTTYNMYVGAGGAAGASSGTNGATGTDSMFSASSTMLAKGGPGGYGCGNGFWGGIGTTVGGVGGTVYAGGNGGNGGVFNGSGGGGEGGNSTSTGQNGGNGSSGVAGAAGGTIAGGGGDGGNGAVGKLNAAGSAGSQPGGGGSGGSVGANTTNRAGGAGGTGRLEITYTTPKISELTDNFDDNSFDDGKWVRDNTTQVKEQNQRLELNTLAGSANYVNMQAPVQSTTVYDATSSAATIKVVSAGDQSLSSYEAYPLGLWYDIDNGYFWLITQGHLEAYQRVASAGTLLFDVGAGYSTTTIPYLRIRNANGTTYWETSGDGLSWTTQYSKSTALNMENIYVEFTSGQYAAETATSTMILDDFNILPSPPATGGGEAQSEFFF